MDKDVFTQVAQQQGGTGGQNGKNKLAGSFMEKARAQLAAATEEAPPGEAS